MKCSIYLFLWSFSLFSGTIGGNAPIVDTVYGRVQGNHQKSYFGRTISAFEGIPYAKPPVGNLRFKEPVPAEKWNDVLIADKHYMCAQFFPLPMMHGLQGTEDCLYLYIYVPREEINPEENLPVIIHIHGGAFMVGSPKMMAMPDYVMDKDVVYVTMNYRLGVLGFLSTEDGASPGNYGLKDQTLALKWIKNNIKSFGGNSDSITLTGLSAGASSVHYHYLSPLSRGLFHRGWSQSGTALQSWALTEKPLEKAKVVAAKLNCANDDNQKMVDCVRTKKAEDVVMAIRELLVLIDFIPYCPFGPIVEKGPNSFLPEHPYKLLKDGKVYDVPWIVSNVQHEGLFPAGFFILFDKLDVFNTEWDKYIPYALDYKDTVDDDKLPEVSKKIKEFYLKNLTTITRDNIYTFTQIFTDRMYTADAEKAVRLHTKAVKSPVYYYFFTYILEQAFFFPMKPGTSHSDDARLLFKLFINPPELDPEDEKLMKLFTDFLHKYATTGVPVFADTEWKTVKPGVAEIDTLLIESPSKITMVTKKEFAPNQFWDSLPIQETNNLFP